MKTPRRLMPLLLCAALLSACGQRGPLYLPDKETPASPPPATTEPAGQEEDDVRR